MCFVSESFPLSEEDENTQLPLPYRPRWQYLKAPSLPVVGFVVLVGQFAIGFVDVTFTIHLQKNYVSATGSSFVDNTGSCALLVQVV